MGILAAALWARVPQPVGVAACLVRAAPTGSRPSQVIPPDGAADGVGLDPAARYRSASSATPSSSPSTTTALHHRPARRARAGAVRTHQQRLTGGHAREPAAAGPDGDGAGAGRAARRCARAGDLAALRVRRRRLRRRQPPGHRDPGPARRDECEAALRALAIDLEGLDRGLGRGRRSSGSPRPRPATPPSRPTTR